MKKPSGIYAGRRLSGVCTKLLNPNWCKQKYSKYPLACRLSDKSCPRRKPLFRGRARHVARYGGGYRHGLYNGPIYDSCPGYGAGYSYGYGGCPGYGGVVGGLIGGVLGGYRPF